MNLIITNYNNFFKIKGVLNRKNLHIFQNEFQNIFEKANAIVISIEGLDDIDRYGVNALARLHNESISKQKSLSIIGMGAKGVFEHFKSEEVA